MRIGSYEVVRELGRGGMGVVYAVRSPDLPGLRALKVLSGLADLESRERFQREAELMARLRHPGVVRIHEVGVHGVDPFLVMDLVEGESLDRVLRRGPVESELAYDCVLQLADAVGELHRQGLLHRDLKPANAMLSPEGRVVLLDFGLARSVGRSSLTQTGVITGSPGFMAPEQVDGTRDQTPALDVHGLGAVLFTLLTGAAPFRGETIFAALSDLLEREAEWPASVDSRVAEIGRRALAKAPEARFADASEFASALRGALAVTPRGGSHLVGALLLLLLLLLAGGGALAWGLGAPAGPGPSRAASASPTPTLEPSSRPLALPLTPGKGWQRALWYREARRRGSKSLSDGQRAHFERLQLAPLHVLPRDKMIRARFWGDRYWLRCQEDNVTWRRFASERRAGSLDQHVSDVCLSGSELWMLVGGELWVAREPGESPARLDFGPHAESLKLSNISRLAVRSDRFALAGGSTVCEFVRGGAANPKVFTQDEYRGAEGILYTAKGRLALRVRPSMQDKRIVLIDDPDRVWELEALPESFAAHPSEEWIAIGTRPGQILVWRPDEEQASSVELRDPGLQRGTAHSHRVTGLAFSPDGSRIYSASRDASRPGEGRSTNGEFKVWRREGANWDLVRSVALEWPVTQISVSPGGAWLLLSTPLGRAEVWAAGDAESP